MYTWCFTVQTEVSINTSLLGMGRWLSEHTPFMTWVRILSIHIRSQPWWLWWTPTLGRGRQAEPEGSQPSACPAEPGSVSPSLSKGGNGSGEYWVLILYPIHIGEWTPTNTQTCIQHVYIYINTTHKQIHTHTSMPQQMASISCKSLFILQKSPTQSHIQGCFERTASLLQLRCKPGYPRDGLVTFQLPCWSHRLSCHVAHHAQLLCERLALLIKGEDRVHHAQPL